MILPLITYPYLIRVLGAQLYGTVIFVQTIIAYFSIVINYGFEVSATKDISINRNDKNKLSEIVSSAYLIKFVFWIILLAVLLLTINIVPFFKQNKLLYILTFTITFNELLFPVWYFQGMEKMKYITLINVAVRSLFLVLVFVFIKDKNDYLLVPLFNGIGAFMGGMAALYIILAKDNIRLVVQPVKTLLFYLKDNLPIFFSNIIISVKDRFNIILIGSFLGMNEVAVYDLGIKIMTVFMQPINMANNAVYPKVAREKNMNFIRKFIKLSFLLVVIAIIIIQPFLSMVVNFLSGNLKGATTISRILLLSPVIYAVSLAIARNVILAFGKYKYIFTGVVYTTLFYLVLIGFGYFFNFLGNVYIFAAITVSTYLFELLYRLKVYKKLSSV